MIEIVKVSLENEMDLTLAYKKSIKVGEQLGLTVSTQTAFATAVSEVSREIIDKTYDGRATIGVISEDSRYFLTAKVSFTLDRDLKNFEEGFLYAKKLVPYFDLSLTEDGGLAEMRLGIPRTAKLTKGKILDIKFFFEIEGPTSAYEEVKLKNLQLSKLTAQQELLLTQSQYLNEQKNEFLSLASHELKSPLTILKAYTQMALALKDGCAAPVHNYLKKIEVQTFKLNTLIQQLLDVAKIENGKVEYNMEEVDMNTYITETFELIKHLVPQHEVIIEMGDTSVVVIDKVRMEQVLANIVINAAKYSKSGSQIRLTTKCDTDGKITVSVKDNGIGMSEDTLNKVFQKFYRNEHIAKKYSGLGMGLYISSKIVNDHGGEILVDSLEGEGSSFHVSIPQGRL